MIRRKIYFGLLLFFCFQAPVSGQAEKTNWVLISTIKARPAGMSGAYTAVKDPFNAVDYNPAALSAATNKSGVNYSVYLNGGGLIAAGLIGEDLMHWDLIFGMGVKGFTVSSGRLSLAVSFGEESITDKPSLKPNDFSTATYRRYRHSTAGFCLNFASNVSIGAAVETGYFNKENGRKWHFGYRYGIYVETMHNVSLGLCFVNYPQTIENERSLLDRFTNESLNLGIAWHIKDNIMFSFDIRNVSDEDKDAFTEPRAGTEWMPFSFIKLRAGASWATDGRNMRSIGIGLFPYVNSDPSRAYLQSRVSLDISMIHIKQKVASERWFFASLLFRIGPQ
jgi:hypothetical protein